MDLNDVMSLVAVPSPSVSMSESSDKLLLFNEVINIVAVQSPSTSPDESSDEVTIIRASQPKSALRRRSTSQPEWSDKDVDCAEHDGQSSSMNLWSNRLRREPLPVYLNWKKVEKLLAGQGQSKPIEINWWSVD